MSEILSHFPGLGEDRARPFLGMMVDKFLMFNEGEKYLSLAVPISGLLDGVTGPPWRNLRRI
ncbi:MAG: hypothetical protein JRJ50_11765 [Deltaproteobacteria bacterium]|nr:hypothetical protein [Deltaproteobacteria bacterium]